MQKFLQLFILITGMFLSFNAIAETVIVPRAANVRSSKIFYGQRNIIAQLPQGAKVEIISRRPLPSGADSLEITIISPTDKIYLNEQKPIYIWQSKSEIKNNLFKTEAGVACINCDTKNTSTTEPAHDIKNIINKIEEQQSQNDFKSTPSQEEVTLPQGSLGEAIKKYSESEQVKKTFEWANSKKPWVAGQCYQHTKEALATQTKMGSGPGNNLIPNWYASAKAKYGVNDLKQSGFINLLDHTDYKNMTSQTAPHGAVLIYSHVNSKGLEDGKAGHAEIKFDDIVDGKNVQRYFYGPLHSYPVNNKAGSRYKLIGIMIKHPMKDNS